MKLPTGSRLELQAGCLNPQLGMQDLLPPEVPVVSVSKGLEAGTGHMMSEIIPSALGRRQPCAFLSGPSFAREVMTQCPTGVVAASKVCSHVYPWLWTLSGQGGLVAMP